MAEIQLLWPQHPFDTGLRNTCPEPNTISPTIDVPSTGNIPSPHLRIADLADDDNDLDGFFVDLPPLLRGEPHQITRDLISQRQSSIEREVDGEKAFFVADIGEVWKQHQRWTACLPRVEPFYAIKCNPDPYVLRLLAALRTGFDCASYGEISRVLSLGVEPSRIIFANPCKAASFIRNAAQIGVDMMTFDNVDELHKIARVHPKAELVLRILTDDSKSVCRLGIKFGATLASVPTLLVTAKALGLNVIGVSFHVGSGCYDPAAFGDAVERAHTVFNIGRDVGYRFRLLDIGGGFETAVFERTASVIRNALDEYFPPDGGVRIIAEPGRYYVATAFTLATNIIARRAAVVAEDRVGGHQPSVHTGGEGEASVMYYINDGVYGSFNCILFDHQIVHPYPLTIGHAFSDTSAADCTPTPCSVWGPTCDSIDCVKPLVELPRGLEVGDWVGFPEMGAYTICAASQFNGFQESAVHYCSGTGQRSRAVRSALARFACSL